jgi:hypothetical protein
VVAVLEVVRGLRNWIALVIAISGSAAMYWNHVNRAVGEAGLCRAVEKHVAKLNADADGAIRSDAIGLVESIGDQCETHFSKSQARCILKAGSMAAVRACN